MNTNTAIEGGCLCGRVRYRVAGALGEADNCHCSMCRRQHGAAYATYADCNPEAFSWVAGERFVRTWASPNGAGWCFCAECGATLAGAERGVVTSVTLGTVDGDPGTRPAKHIFVGSKAPWHEICDDLPQFAARPPGDEP